MTLLVASSRAASRFSRVAAAASSKKNFSSPASAGASPIGRFFSSSAEDTTLPPFTLTRDDVVDSDGLLQFTTLHEMNLFASIAFKDNPLFGTFKAPVVEENVVKDQKDEKGSFEWMTYGEYGELTSRCRSVLKDLGE